MSENSQRSLWQVLGLYAAGSWVVLQVVDILTDRFPLPDWTFTLTVALLVIGLPITAATAYLQGFLVRHRSAPRGLHQRLLTWSNVVRGGVGALAVWGIAVTGWLLLSDGTASQLDVVTGMAEIERLAGAGNFAEGYAIAEDLDSSIDADSLRTAMWAFVSVPVALETEPSGARVFRRAYAPADAPWEELGRTPLNVDHYQLGLTRLRFELDGYRSREVALEAAQLPGLAALVLDREGDLPEGMATVAGSEAFDGYGLFAPGLEQVPSVDVVDFLMATHEVTNADFKAFVDAGGYSDASCWEHPFVVDGRTLSFEEGMARFVDATGRPGPSTWDAGTYPAGTAEHPVGGVSWFEAAAYACWTGLALPTVYHWYRAANPFSSPHVVSLSNYGDGPAPVGRYQGVSRDGIYDLAGNVREWTYNANGESRFILGGGWADQEYSFNDAVTAPAFDRSAMNGIRLAKYPDTTLLAAARAPLALAFRDYRAEEPVSDEVFAAYQQLYAMEDVPLDARVVETDTTELWIRERVEMEAGYGGERLTTFIFLPRDKAGPHQPVLFFPGSTDIYRRSYDDLSIDGIEFILRSGRAIIYPIYRGTFERDTGLRSDIQDMSNLWRDHMVAWSKDLRRAVDYAATRGDLVVDDLSYLGISWGSAVAPVMVANEGRIRAVVLIVGGLLMQETQPGVDPFNFLPRVRQPTIMLSARYDSFYPLETAGRPFFEQLGTPPDQKRLVVYDANHGILGYARNEVVRETLDWLDRYVGPAR